MKEHRVQYGQGAQTIDTIAVSDLGLSAIPSAATYEIVDERYSDTQADYVVQAAQAATVDNVSTTTTAACGRSSGDDPSLITLSSVAGIVVGRRYLLANSKGQSEPITVAGIDAGTLKVRAATEPQRAYPTGATFRGLEVRASVPSAVCNDDDYFAARLRVIWTFTGVSPSRVSEAIKLIRPQPAWVSVDELMSLDDSLAARGSASSDLASALAIAHRDVQSDFRASGLDPYAYDPGPLGADMVLYRAAWHALKTAPEGSAAADRATDYKLRYLSMRATLTSGRDKPGVSEVDPESGQGRDTKIRSLFMGLWE